MILKKLSKATMPISKEQKCILHIERAISDIKRGFPIILEHHGSRHYVIASEALTSESLELIGDNQKIVITNKRYQYISNSQTEESHDFTAELKNITAEKISEIISLSQADITGLNFKPASELQSLALKAVQLGEMLPSAIVAQATELEEDFLTISSEQLANYKDLFTENLSKICTTPLRLKHAEDCQFVAFRSMPSGKEHYAIIIGNPGEVPLVRVHSSCYTGDLLASLSCDCRDQLHLAIEKASQNKAGIILYLNQEGRGIGLVNKLRAYNLKEQGFDTVEANENLGFDDDQRIFAPAAKMLKILNVNKINLLTNNPRKGAELEKCGISVQQHTPLIVESNEHNKSYLDTKATKLGHKI